MLLDKVYENDNEKGYIEVLIDFIGLWLFFFGFFKVFCYFYGD